ncbi:MAG TPA: hypothetical protein PKB10_07165, partial [Tepidisphaeraceae bacterium]|nr:hypothetical protein [Tepidisphaeraceae bacterium]
MTAASPGSRGRFRRDLVAAYVATGMKIVAWAVVSAMLLRYGSAEQLAVFALLRATIGLLQYTTLGLAPALVRQLTAERLATPVEIRAAYNTALVPAGALAALAIVLLAVYGVFIDSIHNLPDRIHPGTAGVALLLLGVGFVLRLWSDVTGAVLHVGGRMWIDSLILAIGDMLWLGMTLGGLAFEATPLTVAAGAFAGSGVFVAAARVIALRRTSLAPGHFTIRLDWGVMRFLLVTGG